MCAERTKVFVDVDTGIDDAIALIYLLASSDGASDETEVIGIASTGGNISVDQVCTNNLGLLEVCGAPDIPVSKGAADPLCGDWPERDNAHGSNGLGYATLPSTDRRLTGYDATTAWVDAARNHPGELIGLVTGPLTNLALALRIEPALPTLLRRLVIMGGAYDHQGNITPAAEWNIRVDPEAAAEVLTAWAGQQQLPTLCGLDLTRKVAMTPEILQRLVSAMGESPLTRVVEDALRFYFEAHQGWGYGQVAYMHDPLAAAVALDPYLVATRPARVDIELTGTLTRGMTVTNWSGLREPNALIGVDVDPAVFFDRLIERVGPFARRLG